MRIERWHIALADYFRNRLSEAFGQEAILGAQHDEALKSGIVAFTPFVGEALQQHEALNIEFRERLLADYGFRISGKGLGRHGLTRSPDPEADLFPPTAVPNRDPLTLAPAPMPHPQRVNACVWNTREQVDRFVLAARELADLLQT